MKNTLFKASLKTILFASVLSLASCKSLNSQPNDEYSANPVRIINNDSQDNLISDAEKNRIVVPSVSAEMNKKIVITKETIAQAKQNKNEILATKVATPEVEVVSTGVLINKEIPSASQIIETPKLKEVKAEILTPAIPVSSGVGTTSAANAIVGECYGKVKTAAKFKEVEEQVIAVPEKVNTSVIPARFVSKEDEITVKEETYKFVEIPATYKTVAEQVVIEPERKEIITIPAKYSTIKERVVATPARKVWKKGNGLINKTSESGDILCLVEEPATYKDVEKQVLVAAERTEARIIPAVTKTITKQVIDQPAKVEKIYVPAVKQKVQQKVLVEAEKTVTNKIPAIYKTVRKNVQTSEPKIELMPVICERNITSDLIYRLQAALASKGYNISNIDGKFGEETAEAVYKFQKSLGLESGGITFETIKALNIQI